MYATGARVSEIVGLSLGDIDCVAATAGPGLIGGVLVGSYIGQINFYIGFIAGIKAFTAAVLGGIGSIPGAVLGGFIVGIASNLALLVLPSGYSPAVPFLLILAVLILRPNGLFGEARA